MLKRLLRLALMWGRVLGLCRRGQDHRGRQSGQRALEAVRPFSYKDQYVTPAGVLEKTVLVFDLPKDVKEPYLKVTDA
jgi:hypothetical protein